MSDFNLILEKIEKNVFLAKAVISTNRSENLTDILNNLRAFEGITIINMIGKSKFVSSTKEVANIDVKFIPDRPLFDYIKFIEEKISSYDEIFDFRITEIVNFTQEQERKRKQRSRVYAIRKSSIVPEPPGPRPGRPYASES